VKFPSPLYTAVIEWVPALSVVVAIEAAAEETLAGDPIGLDPSIHWTVPVAELANAAVKDAENVTDCPKTDGVCEVVAATVGVALLTT
jgi:hypothetical protein